MARIGGASSLSRSSGGSLAGAPYPADTKAKGWRFEVDHERIRQSDTWALATPDVRPWLLMLWMVAWEQTPCGSLPDNDELIAVRIGMTAKAFQKHRPVLLRAWVKADDGRLYHHVITLRVLEMLAKRAKDAERAANNRARKAESHPSPPGVTAESRVTNDRSAREFDTKHQAPSTSHPTGESPDKPAKPTRPRKPRAQETLLPDGFSISQGVRAWAAEHGYQRLEEHFDAFVDKAKANGYAYADWDAALKNAIRGDWANLRGKRAAPAGEAATVSSGDAARTMAHLAAQARHDAQAVKGAAAVGALVAGIKARLA